VNILLEAFERAQKTVEYFALDLSLSELKRTFAELDTSDFHYVSFHALHGTYDDALSWLGQSRAGRAATCVMTMGSSLGNFTRDGASQFLASFKNALAASDFMLVGLDACQQPERVFRAYHDSQHVTEQFYRNGLVHANKILGYEAFKPDEWEIEGFYDEESNKHQASYVALKTIHVKDFHFEKGEKIHFEDAFKYSEVESDALWHAAGFILQMSYGNASNDYRKGSDCALRFVLTHASGIHLLSPSSINFPTKPTEFAASPVPSQNDWRQLWAAWDTVTKSMVPRDELLNKPIKLRNDLIFYLGHIPTFAGIPSSSAC
jgi:EasF-like predicted methyltransferase